jgi:uncharacterized protein (TIGR03067 family)
MNRLWAFAFVLALTLVAGAQLPPRPVKQPDPEPDKLQGQVRDVQKRPVKQPDPEPDKLQGQVRDLQKQVTTLRTQLDETRQQVDTLKRQVAQTARQTEQLKAQQVQLDTLQTQAAKLTEDLVRVRDGRHDLVGVWKTISVTENGRAKADPASRLVFTAAAITFKYADGQRDQTWAMRLDSTGSPKTIDVFGSGVIPTQGIYTLDGDTLKICIDRGSGVRPAALNGSASENTALWVLERVTERTSR